MRLIYVFPILFISNIAFGADCSLPSGEVNYSDSSYTPPTLNKENGSKTFVTPSKDCSSVRVWIYTAGRDGLAVAPSDSQCNKPQGKSSDSLGLVQCADFPVYKSEKDSAGMHFPLAFMKNGALVTRESEAGTSSALSGIYFQKSGSANQVTEMSHTSASQSYLAGSYPGTIRVFPDQPANQPGGQQDSELSSGSYPGTLYPASLNQPRRPAGNRNSSQ